MDKESSKITCIERRAKYLEIARRRLSDCKKPVFIVFYDSKRQKSASDMTRKWETMTTF
jgi:hypothetical protein